MLSKGFIGIIHRQQSTLLLTTTLNQESYIYIDIHTVPINAILTLVDPRARRDCIYTLSKREFIATSEHLLIVSKATVPILLVLAIFFTV